MTTNYEPVKLVAQFATGVTDVENVVTTHVVDLATANQAGWGGSVVRPLLAENLAYLPDEETWTLELSSNV